MSGGPFENRKKSMEGMKSPTRGLLHIMPLCANNLTRPSSQDSGCWDAESAKDLMCIQTVQKEEREIQFAKEHKLCCYLKTRAL